MLYEIQVCSVAINYLAFENILHSDRMTGGTVTSSKRRYENSNNENKQEEKTLCILNESLCKFECSSPLVLYILVQTPNITYLEFTQ